MVGSVTGAAIPIAAAASRLAALHAHELDGEVLGEQVAVGEQEDQVHLELHLRQGFGPFRRISANISAGLCRGRWGVDDLESSRADGWAREEPRVDHVDRDLPPVRHLREK